MSPLFGAGQRQESTRKSKFKTIPVHNGVKTSDRFFGTRSKQRECWQQQYRNSLWPEKTTPDSSIGLKNREICLKQRWKHLKRWIHKVFSTGNSLCRTGSVLRSKGFVRTSWQQWLQNKDWIREVSCKPESPLREKPGKKSLAKVRNKRNYDLIAILRNCISPSGHGTSKEDTGNSGVSVSSDTRKQNCEKAARQAGIFEGRRQQCKKPAKIQANYFAEQYLSSMTKKMQRKCWWQQDQNRFWCRKTKE